MGQVFVQNEVVVTGVIEDVINSHIEINMLASLETFAYHTRIEVWIFIVAILIAFLITFLTVTWQSLKSARTNPVKSLRYE